MNQAASATRRAPADSTASAGGCCPMLNAPFLGLQMPPAAAQCFLNPQAQQIVHQLARQQQQQSNVVLPPQQQTVSQQPSNLVGQQQQQQQLQSQSQQPATQRSHNQTSNHYSTSPSAHNFSLQQSLANRLPGLNCALALSTAFASYLPQFQQPLMTQNHQATPINQQTQTVSGNMTVSQSNTSPTFTNQVPLSNFNSYSSAQSFINNNRLAVPQSTPPVAAHHQQQTNDIPSNILPTNLNAPAQNTQSSNSENNPHQNVQQPRPLMNNMALNSSTSQMADPIYRSSQHRPTDISLNVHHQHHHQPTSTSSPSHLAQLTRNILNDDALHSQLLQAVLLQQFLEQQIVPPLPPPPPPASQVQSQPMSVPQQLINSTTRTQATLPLTGQLPVVMTPAQQVTSTPIAPPQQQHRPSEQVSENQQQAFQQQSRINQAQPPPPQPTDSYPNLVGNANGAPYLSQSINDLHIQRSSSDQVLQAHQGSQPTTQAPQIPMQQPQSPQHTQPQAGLSVPFYPYPQDARTIEQSLAAFASGTVLRQILASLAHGTLRIDPHQQFPIHHYHQHLHGTHHHHHSQNGQANGQDASMPLDSLAINESKPRGLSRAEIDSLTPYMHTNEKDARSCVICLSKFELKSKIRPLPCNHAFHAKCVDKWLRTNRTCPICRRDALKTFNGKIKRI